MNEEIEEIGFKPHGDYLLVQLLKPHEEAMRGSLYLPSISNTNIVEGIIVETGLGKYSEFTGKVSPMEYSIGGRILFNKNLAIELNLKNKVYYLIRQVDIFGWLYEPKN